MPRFAPGFSRISSGRGIGRGETDGGEDSERAAD
jgi:hypothetical protein